MADPVPGHAVSPAGPVATPPPADLIARALRAAVAVRIAGYRQDERYTHYTLAALRERVVALPVPPRLRPDGWWSAGRLLDDLGGVEVRVWMHPERRRLRMRAHRLPEPGIPEPARHPDGRFYDGASRRWMLPDGREAASVDASDPPRPA